VGANESEYSIQGGRSDADRLARQAKVMARATEAFLADAGLGPGWACLDVGCGDGQVTLAMARAVGSRGRVVGIDIDSEALELCRQNSARAGLAAEFISADAAQAVEPEAFDLAYARLVLSHLVDPQAVLRAMRDSVHTGGVVAIEDLFTGTLRSDPPSAALDELQEVYSATVRDHGGDPTIGPRLRALLAATGLQSIHEHTVANPMRSVDEKLFLAELIDGMREAIVAAGAATHAELDQLRANVERAARDPDTVFHQARIHQVRSRRPGVRERTTR
jgi:ubiquinone/menaquinone biosynthesis C-methylase UbiE